MLPAMGIDAVFLLRPKKPSLLKGVVDPETASVRVLDDGSLLFSTFTRYREIEADRDAGRAMLSTALADAHDDRRGVLFFPDVCEPRGRSYDAVVQEVEAAGVWIPARPLTDAEVEARAARMVAEVEAIVAASQALQRGEPIDPEMAARLNPPPGPSLGDLQQKMAALLSTPEAMAGLEAAFAMGSAVVLLQRPSRKPLAATYPGLSVNEQRALADGALVVHTDRGGSEGAEMVALALGESLQEWVSEHTDARGVPVFMSPQLHLVDDATSYDDALRRLGDHVRFVTPHTIEDVIAGDRARLRAYLEDE
jgi:hypothetical protein